MTDASENFDPEAVLAALAGAGVEFVLIGGVAAQVFGVSRATGDIDVLIHRTPENYARLAACFEALVPDHDAFDLARGENIRVLTTHGILDLLVASGGLEYDAAAKRAVTTKLGNVDVLVAGLDDLVYMKRVAGRPKDLLDLAELTTPTSQHHGS